MIQIIVNNTSNLFYFHSDLSQFNVLIWPTCLFPYDDDAGVCCSFVHVIQFMAMKTLFISSCPYLKKNMDSRAKKPRAEL